MKPETTNIYKASRMAAPQRFSQEEAAEALHVSTRSLAAYESETNPTPVGDDMAYEMAELYEDHALLYWHMRKSKAGRAVVPEVEIKDLPKAVLGLLDKLNKFSVFHNTMISIAADGVIEDTEQQQWEEITQMAQEILYAIMTVKFAK